MFCPLLSPAQERVIIKGKIKDEMGDIIPYPIKVQQIKNPGQFRHSDNHGNFIFPYNYNDDPEDGLLFHSIGYQDLYVKIGKKLFRKRVGDTIYLKVQLPYATLEGPTITAFKPPDTAFRHPTLSVQDFEFHLDRFVLLTFEKSMSRGTEVLLATTDTVLSRYQVPGEAVSLFKDFRERIYVICKEKVFLCSFRNDRVALSPVLTDDFYSRNWLILDSLGTQFYYSNRNELYPGYEYFAQHFDDTVPTRLHHVEDELIMDLYRAEYKYANGQEKLWAVRQEMATGVDKEVWMGAKYFTQSLYYKVPYAPLFVREDTVFVFDHYRDLLYKFNQENEKIDSIPIYYHKATKPSKWEQPLIDDETTQDIYGLFMRQGHSHLKLINTETGMTSLAFRVYYKFAENIKIDKGYVYYIYRPYESAQERYIYREKIKLKEDEDEGFEKKSE